MKEDRGKARMIKVDFRKYKRIKTPPSTTKKKNIDENVHISFKPKTSTRIHTHQQKQRHKMRLKARESNHFTSNKQY